MKLAICAARAIHSLRVNLNAAKPPMTLAISQTTSVTQRPVSWVG